MLFIFTVIVLVLCHAQESHSRPGSDLDTSVFELEYDYNYDSEPYFPQENMGLKEARMVDPWTLDFRRKLAARENIGKTQTASVMRKFSAFRHFFKTNVTQSVAEFILYSQKTQNLVN